MTLRKLREIQNSLDAIATKTRQLADEVDAEICKQLLEEDVDETDDDF